MGEGGRGHSCQAVPMGKGAVTPETWACQTLILHRGHPTPGPGDEIREEEEPQRGESYPVTAVCSSCWVTYILFHSFCLLLFLYLYVDCSFFFSEPSLLLRMIFSQIIIA